ncbi:MAG: ATP-binding cassette domain-containing protein [Rhodobacteraceae bacterium]|nr:ATP-binding cassette domain-containing protein [Paracoccaceae bacterium]MCY4142044.1 ATP-binding cassette domain-containing protein [Paracoccaceae bacterium]
MPDAAVPEHPASESTASATAIAVEGLKVHFRTFAGRVRAVDGVDLNVKIGAFHGIVGESGCGKTTLARTIVGLQSPTAGQVRILGRDRAKWQSQDRMSFARTVQFIFQDPLGSMSRRQSVQQTMEEPLRIHGKGDARERRRKIKELLDLVALPVSVLDRLPRSLSGGQRQRVSIARALALNPEVLICDEPLSALDVSVRAQIVNLFARLQAQLNLTIIIVAHDLAIVREVCSAVTVMYLGRVAEEGAARPLFADPAHPYSQALLSAVPSPDPRIEEARSRVLLEGDPPSPLDPPAGCRFSTRCPVAVCECRSIEPTLRSVRHGGRAACHLADESRHPIL